MGDFGEWTTVKRTARVSDEPRGKKKSDKASKGKAPSAPAVPLNILGKPAVLKTKNLFAEAEQAEEAKRRRQEELEEESYRRKEAEELAKKKGNQKKSSKPKEAPAKPKKLPAADEVGRLLMAERVKMRISSDEAQYSKDVEMQLLSMVEFLDDGFDSVSNFEWEKKFNTAIDTNNADNFPRSILRAETAKLLTEWIATKDPKAVRDVVHRELIPLVFPEIALVASRRVMQTQGIGQKLFLQLALHAHPDLFNPAHPFFKLNNFKESSLRAGAYVIMQLGRGGGAGAFRAWRSIFFPFFSTDSGPATAALALSYLATRSKGPRFLPVSDLGDLFQCAFLTPKSTPARDALRSLWPSLTNVAIIDIDDAVPGLLQLFSEIPTSHADARDAILKLVLFTLKKNGKAFAAWEKVHGRYGVATAHVLVSLAGNWRGLQKVNKTILQNTLDQMEAAWSQAPKKGGQVVPDELIESRTRAVKTLRSKVVRGSCCRIVTTLSFCIALIGAGGAFAIRQGLI